MSKRKPAVLDGTTTIDGEQYTHMVNTMIELANRDHPTEAIVLRIAKAGGVNEVVKHITRLRVYLKKHQIEPREDRSQRNPAKRSNRRRTPRNTDSSADSAVV